MARLIDAEPILMRWNTESLGRKEMYDMVKNAPTIDVAPVRHGRWEKNDDLFLDTLYRCSVCGEEFYLENGTPQENQYYYCPNCGAKMDGEKKNCDTCKHYDKRWDDAICDGCTTADSHWERRNNETD